MATCERVVKEPVPPPVEYVLRLSEAEAWCLRHHLCASEWGQGDAHALLSIDHALSVAGIKVRL